VTVSPSLVARVAQELSLAPSAVAHTLALFGEGNTLPFIARYRKEATGGLDEVQLRDVRDRALYLTELDDRKSAVLASIAEQGKLDAALEAAIRHATTKQAVEDLYLPFKQKKRTRSMMARERGLAPLAEAIWSGAMDDAGAMAMAATLVAADRDVPDADAALAGACDILAEHVADDASVRGWMRDRTRAEGTVTSTVIKGKATDDSKFRDYFAFSEAVTTLPSHRMLAIRRGEAEGVLVWRVVAPAEGIVSRLVADVTGGRRATVTLTRVATDAYQRLLSPAIEVELRVELKQRADAEAIRIFGRNLEQLLLSPPAGARAVLGLDPGFRTGVKVALVTATGALAATDTWYLHQEERFAQQVAALIRQHAPALVAIGNGTASRETEAAVKRALRALDGERPQVVVVNEAGASVYSASDAAREEFPDLDVSIRGAVSIARRLQDPLAELVKIEPKAIGVGQYQHDVHQPTLKTRLDETVESCVNRVGVEVNTASAALLSYVAGIGPTLARTIVTTRDAAGGFRSRAQLREVPRLGAKAFEQAAGFLRVRGGAHPLDATAVHPERYALVEHMARDLGVEVASLVGNEAMLGSLDLRRYASDSVGVPTLEDIRAELLKPGRDPRAAFEPPAFRDDVLEPKDLTPGMVLDGVVTNIVAFGAFVDVGVHQDGLVHVSQLADRYVRDPNEVVSVGQKVRVTVVEVDLPRQRIALTMRSVAAGPKAEGRPARKEPDAGSGKRRSAAAAAPAAAPTAAPAIPAKGTVARNGMRFT
jgi:protein Tex